MHSFIRPSEPKFTHSIPRRPTFLNGKGNYFFRHSSAQRTCAKHYPPKADESSLWVPITSMRVKFPISTYNLNGFLQASMLHLFKPSACGLLFCSGGDLFFL